MFKWKNWCWWEGAELLVISLVYSVLTMKLGKCFKFILEFSVVVWSHSETPSAVKTEEAVPLISWRLPLSVQDERHQQKEQHLLTVQEERPRQAEAGGDCGQTAEKPGQRHVLLNPNVEPLCTDGTTGRHTNSSSVDTHQFIFTPESLMETFPAGRQGRPCVAVRVHGGSGGVCSTNSEEVLGRELRSRLTHEDPLSLLHSHPDTVDTSLLLFWKETQLGYMI